MAVTKAKRARIRLLKHILLNHKDGNGAQHTEAGTELEVERHLAIDLTGSGMAEYMDDDDEGPGGTPGRGVRIVEPDHQDPGVTVVGGPKAKVKK